MNEHIDDIAVLILAAGASSRMGEPKQLLPWGKSTLLEHAISTAISVNSKNSYIVLGAHSETIRKNINFGGIVSINNPNYKAGQGSSLSCGIDFLMQKQNPFSGVLITLCDQPLITSTYLLELIQVFKQGKKGIVATAYGNKAGVPAIFAQKYFDELKNSKGDIGARKILEAHKKDRVTINPKGRQLDLDTQEEYKALIDKSSNQN